MVAKKRFGLVLLSAALLGLTACSGSGSKPKPEPLPDMVPLVRASVAWNNPVGPVPSHFRIGMQQNRLAVASENGTVAVIDARSGKDVWRTKLNAEIRAGAGYDGHMAAVVTAANELTALVNGETAWKRRLDTAVFTPPLVAGQRIFVLGADQSISAFDGNTGSRLWSQPQNNAEPLILKQAGVLLAFDDTLVVGVPGRLLGLNPNNGTPKWDVPITRWNANRGSSDIERLIDMVGPAHRVGLNSLCVRAYQVGVGCVDVAARSIKWSQVSYGLTGLHGDANAVIATERDGVVHAWKRDSGDKLWTQTQLKYRDLGAPLVAGRTVAIGDGLGFVHLLSREDGSLLSRLPTDGSPITAPLVLSENLLIAATRSGNVFAWRPQ
jgi:outer membrane assembly lipoprotein YfgL